jgi:hypothetical protein
MTAGKYDGITVASACSACAWIIGSPPECAPGRHMQLMHDHHVPELVALGWTVTDYPEADEPPDVVCPHYPALCEEGEDGRDAS